MSDSSYHPESQLEEVAIMGRPYRVLEPIEVGDIINLGFRE